MGLSGRSVEEVAAWVEASCREQGVPVHVTDAEVLRDVVALLGGSARSGSGLAATAALRTSPRQPSLEPPHRMHPGRVQGLGSALAWADDTVIHDGGHDRVLTTQIQ